VLSGGLNGGQETGVGDDVPREVERDVSVVLQPIAVVPEVVLGVHVLEVQHGVLAAQDDLVPEDHLVELVRGSLVLGGQVQEQLLHVPVEDAGEVRLQVEGHEAQVVLLPRGSVVRDILHQHPNRVDVGLRPVVQEYGGQETAEGEAGQDAQRVCHRGVSSG